MSVLSVLLGMNVRQRLRPRRHRAGPTPTLSDEQVLEARRLHEATGIGARALLQHYRLEATRNRVTWMAHILAYRLRSSPTKPLDPKLVKVR